MYKYINNEKEIEICFLNEKAIIEFNSIQKLLKIIFINTKFLKEAKKTSQSLFLQLTLFKQEFTKKISIDSNIILNKEYLNLVIDLLNFYLTEKFKDQLSEEVGLSIETLIVILKNIKYNAIVNNSAMNGEASNQN